MKYTFNNKVINIPDSELGALMTSLEISKVEAVEVWLSDHDLISNEEQTALNTKAEKVKISREASGDKKRKPRKPTTIKVSDEKKELFSLLKDVLTNYYGENVTILKENKLILVERGGKKLKLDLIEQRK